MNNIINFLKLAKCSRSGFINAKRLVFGLSNSDEVRLSSTSYFDYIYLRSNGGDYIAYEQVFRYLCYGELEKLGPIRNVIDAGANIGLSSIYFSKRLQCPEIVAIEPERGNFNQACKNTSGLKNVKLINGALWHQVGSVSIANEDSSGSLGYQVEESSGLSNEVQALTVSKIMETEGWSYLDLLKIDIEGAEKELFEHDSFKEWINRVRVIVIELHDWLRDGCSLPFFRAISELEDIEFMLSGENLIIINKAVRSSR